jgi:ubiquitin carboxyl-terminal hydrolase 14
VEKFSDALGRDASYSKVSVITRLPAYLTIQFVRFFHGRAGQSDELVAKKILKDVKFPLKLDMFEFCSSTLQDRMAPIRKKFRDVEEKKMVTIIVLR